MRGDERKKFEGKKKKVRGEEIPGKKIG